MTWDLKIEGESLCVDHADGGKTLIVRHPEWDAIVTLDARAVKRISDRRLDRHPAAVSPEAPHA